LILSFRLEDGAAICNGGIEVVEHAQSSDDWMLHGGFDPSTSLRKANNAKVSFRPTAGSGGIEMTGHSNSFEYWL
jgi:hypothetical protein